MPKTKHVFFNLALVALALCLASPALALRTKSRTSSGNNLGFEQNLGSSIFVGSHEYPRGSGNYIHTYEGGMGHFLSVVRDINGDGVMEDTSMGASRGRTIGGTRGSLEAYDILKQGYDAGERTDQWASRVEVNEVWSSLDPDNLARWPAEFRQGRTMSGAPILFGKETMCSMLSDCFNRSYHRSTPPLGVSFEYQFYFLDYGEANDIAFGHLFMRNMSEYIQWNSNPDFVAKTASTPQGQNWGEFSLMYVENYVGIEKVGSTSMDEGWIFHPAKQIKGQVDYNGIENGFTKGGFTFVIGYKSLRNASWQNETMELTNCTNMRWASDFGLATSHDIGSLSNTSDVHRWSKAVHDGIEDNLTDILFKNNLSPWTGRPAVGNPGMLLPTDQRYNQWLWGRAGRINYTAWSALHDFGPRDSTSTDFAFMFCYPATPPLVLKPNSIAYIDDPELQAQLVPMEHMGDVVKIVYEAGYILPETPIPPALTIIPGDRQVTITWSNVNLNTPDRYYQFLQQHPEIDPNGYYREYDFEGYKLYRNYTGPQEAHVEEIFKCSVTDNNIQFYYIDTQNKDLSYSRLRNGLRVWYALVPYDRNYDVKTGAEFSLPSPGTSKTWNRPFPEGYHTVRPRSDASNYRAAELASVEYTGTGSAAPTPAATVTLTGDGTGKLTQAPVYLEPDATIEFVPVINEKITQALTLYVDVTDMSPNGVRAGRRTAVLKDGSGNIVDDGANFIMVRSGGNHDLDKANFSGGLNTDGAAYGMNTSFNEDRTGSFHTQIDPGTYTGATATYMGGTWSFDEQGLVFTSDDTWQAFVRNGQYVITWQSSGGNVTATVHDNTRNVDIPFSPYTDSGGWGLVPIGEDPYDYMSDIGADYPGPGNVEKPESQRGKLLVQSLPAGNTEEFNLYVNGQFWLFKDVTAMPANGTVMTITTAFGSWNSDNTQFTQYPDPIYLGDRWKIDINPFSLKDEDINLSRIKVVPNPYIASSILDQSGGGRRIDFVNLPDKCTIRIYSLGGNLVNVLNHIGASRTGWGNFVDVDAIQPDNSPFTFTGYDNHGGTEPWNMQNRFGQTVASGLYFFHVTDARGETHTGKFYIIN